MKRPMMMLALLLALGLLTSLGIAWAGALLDRRAWPDVLLARGVTGTRAEMRGWLVERGRDATVTWTVFDALDLAMAPPGPGASADLSAWSVGHALPDQPGPFVPLRERTRDRAWEVAAGWPLRCVRASRGLGPVEYALPGEFVRGGLVAVPYKWPIAHGSIPEYNEPTVEPWPPPGPAAMVPLRPIAGGLLVNTLVFAAAWAVVLSPLVLPGMWRRRRRLKKGRCVHCGHSAAGLPEGAPCTECGRHTHERVTVREIATGRGPMIGACLVLVLMGGAVASLVVHRWMEVDRLPPLHRAAVDGDLEEMERLIASGAGINETSGSASASMSYQQDTTALNYAAARGQPQAVRLLRDRGAHLWGGSPYDTPLHAAVLGRHEEVVEILLPLWQGRGSRWFEGNMLPHTSLPIIRMIIENQKLTPHDRAGAAQHAIEAVDHELLVALVEPGADLPKSTAEGLFESAIATDGRAWAHDPPHDLGLTRALIDWDIPSMRHWYTHPVTQAIQHKCLPCLDALLDIGVEPRAGQVFEAVRSRSPELVVRLIEASGSPDVSDDHGRTLLWYAALSLKPEMVRVLIDAGADPTREVGGLTMRRALTEGDVAFLGTFWEVLPEERAKRPDEVHRICDMLEAAEAQWHAREKGADAESPAGGT